MTDAQFQMLYAQIVEIREILEATRAGVDSRKTASLPMGVSPARKSTSSVPVPKPSMPIDDPGEVQVHFGKNKGVRLADLSRKSLEWYAQEREPQLRKDGTPFPPRDEDVRLQEAARSLIHGSITGVPVQTADEDDGGNPY